MRYKYIVILMLVLPSGLLAQTALKPYSIGITVNNIDSASRWYVEKLGCTIFKTMNFPEYDSLRIVFLKMQDFQIELIQKKTSFSIRKYQPDYDINKAPMQGFIKFAFKVSNIKKLFETLKNKGAKVILGVTHDKSFNSDFFMIEDLDNNLLQFIEPSK